MQNTNNVFNFLQKYIKYIDNQYFNIIFFSIAKFTSLFQYQLNTKTYTKFMPLWQYLISYKTKNTNLFEMFQNKYFVLQIIR